MSSYLRLIILILLFHCWIQLTRCQDLLDFGADRRGGDEEYVGGSKDQPSPEPNSEAPGQEEYLYAPPEEEPANSGLHQGGGPRYPGNYNPDWRGPGGYFPGDDPWQPNYQYNPGGYRHENRPRPHQRVRTAAPPLPAPKEPAAPLTPFVIYITNPPPTEGSFLSDPQNQIILVVLLLGGAFGLYLLYDHCERSKRKRRKRKRRQRGGGYEPISSAAASSMATSAISSAISTDVAPSSAGGSSVFTLLKRQKKRPRGQDQVRDHHPQRRPKPRTRLMASLFSFFKRGKQSPTRRPRPRSYQSPRSRRRGVTSYISRLRMPPLSSWFQRRGLKPRKYRQQRRLPLQIPRTIYRQKPHSAIFAPPPPESSITSLATMMTDNRKGGGTDLAMSQLETLKERTRRSQSTEHERSTRSS